MVVRWLPQRWEASRRGQLGQHSLPMNWKMQQAQTSLPRRAPPKLKRFRACALSFLYAFTFECNSLVPSSCKNVPFQMHVHLRRLESEMLKHTAPTLSKVIAISHVALDSCGWNHSVGSVRWHWNRHAFTVNYDARSCHNVVACKLSCLTCWLYFSRVWRNFPEETTEKRL